MPAIQAPTVQLPPAQHRIDVDGNFRRDLYWQAWPTFPPEGQRCVAMAVAVVSVLSGEVMDWAAYAGGLAEGAWPVGGNENAIYRATAEVVVRHGSKLTEAQAAALFPALAGAGLHYRN